jgi:concentrative nucleoside transporter, CNT family
MERIQPAIGLLVMIGLLYGFSTNRRAIRWRVVIWGMGLQFAFAVIVLHTSVGERVFSAINDGFLKIMDASGEGSRFLFGPTGAGDYVPVGEVKDGVFQQEKMLVAQVGYNFAFRVLPTIIFFSALMAIGYHLGIMQLVVRAFAKVMAWSMGTSGAETMSNAANIFVGQTEAPLMVRPYVSRMTNSELLTIMVGGFANTAGGVMMAYISMLQNLVPNIGAHLLTSSILTGPASLMMAKLAMPETEESLTAGDLKIPLPKVDTGVVDAAARGTTEGLSLALNVGAMLITFIAVVALVNYGLGAISTHVFNAVEPWSLAMIFGKVLWPVAWLLGVSPQDCTTVGQLLGTKTFLNEFVAYVDLAHMRGLQPRSYLIASYALCGFANISSIGIQIGGIGAMAPERRHDLARLGFKAMIIGAMATFSAACVVAILTK